MATDAPASQAVPQSLPPVGEYLRRLFDLGKESIPAAVPALVFLWFYHFGTELYLEIAGRATSPLGYPDTEARLYHMMMKISAYLPLLVLVYTPFLPLQDSLLRGQPPSFLASIRNVLERLVPFILSAILQTLIIVTPIAVVLGIVVLAIAPVPVLPPEASALIAITVAIPSVLWVFFSAMFLVFAVPAVILDGHGPVRAIAVSFRMVAGHFWGILGRFILFFLLLFVFVMIACIPAMLLAAGGSLLAQAGSLFRIGAILWTSLITALTFPFTVASLMLQYRALAPVGGGETVADVVITGPLGTETPKPGHGEQPTPYIFE
jgi:hypothetical protein